MVASASVVISSQRLKPAAVRNGLNSVEELIAQLNNLTFSQAVCLNASDEVDRSGRFSEANEVEAVELLISREVIDSFLLNEEPFEIGDKTHADKPEAFQVGSSAAPFHFTAKRRLSHSTAANR